MSLCTTVNPLYYCLIIGIGAGLVWLFLKYTRSSTKVRLLKNHSEIQQVEIDHLQIYKAVVQNSPDLFVIVDQGLQVLVANRTASTYGWKTQSLFAEADIAETSRLHLKFELQKVLKSGITSSGEIRMAPAEHDSWKYFMYHIFPIYAGPGEVIGATVTAVDVTAQRDAENELVRQREFAEGIMNAIPDAIYVKNDHQKFIYGNSSFSEIVGRQVIDYSGLKDEDLFPLPIAERIKKSDREVLRTNIPQEVEEEILGAQGKKWTVLSKRIPFHLQGGQKVLISIMRDFSERKRLESELQFSRARQEEAARLATLGETASGIAHEINNPLNILVGIAELMKSKMDKEGSIDPLKLNEYCDKIVNYSMRIAKIIKGLRSISRDASDDPFTEVSLASLLEETMELCRQQLVTRGIEISVSAEDLVVEGRFAQLSQILMNLLNNARDAVEGIPSPKIFLEVKREANDAVIRVWDNGAGVSEEVEKRIMNPFFTTKPAGKGTGLGLSISNSIALDHKGTLSLNRRVSASCFEFRIPLLINLKKKSA